MFKELSNAIIQYPAWMFTGYTRLRSRFIRTKLGTFWVLLANIICITIFSLVYTKVFPTTEPAKYVVYMGIGFSLWTVIATIFNSSTEILIFHKTDLLNSNKSTFFYLLEEFYYQFVNFLIGIFPIIIFLFLKNLLISDNSFGILYPLKLLAATSNFLFAMLFFITLMSLLGIFFRDFKQILPSILQISFLTSPIMFPPSIIGNLANIVYLNPLYTPVAIFRDTLIDPDFYNNTNIFFYLIPLFFILIILLITLYSYWRLRNKIIFYV